MVVLATNPIDQIEPGHVGQHQVEHHAVVPLLLERLERGTRIFRVRQFRGLVADQFPDAVALGLIVFDHEQLLRGHI